MSVYRKIWFIKRRRAILKIRLERLDLYRSIFCIFGINGKMEKRFGIRSFGV